MYFSAPYIYTASSHGILTDHIIETDQYGKILAIIPKQTFKGNISTIELIDGIILPGFINAHCHMELSHMKGMIPTGTGLVEFIKQIVTRRTADLSIIKEAITMAEQEMCESGIVAVGDISNVTDSFDQKQSGRLYYQTFVETFDLMSEQNAEAELEKSLQVYDQLFPFAKSRKTIVPHAPYSVSDKLFQLIEKYNRNLTFSTSIHHQETEAENLFISHKTGALVDFFTGFGIVLDDYIPTGKLASNRVIEHMNKEKHTLLVHNTISTRDDIRQVEAWNPNVYWVTCPNANLYIENKLPTYADWINEKAKICIGTDSLASNWQLSILDEMITIQKYQSTVSTKDLIEWATINGAKALQFDDELGSIEPGKSPGLVAIEHFNFTTQRFSSENRARRLV